MHGAVLRQAILYRHELHTPPAVDACGRRVVRNLTLPPICPAARKKGKVIEEKVCAAWPLDNIALKTRICTDMFRNTPWD